MRGGSGRKYCGSGLFRAPTSKVLGNLPHTVVATVEADWAWRGFVRTTSRAENSSAFLRVRTRVAPFQAVVRGRLPVASCQLLAFGFQQSAFSPLRNVIPTKDFTSLPQDCHPDRSGGTCGSPTSRLRFILRNNFLGVILNERSESKRLPRAKPRSLFAKSTFVLHSYPQLFREIHRCLNLEPPSALPPCGLDV